MMKGGTQDLSGKNNQKDLKGEKEENVNMWKEENLEKSGEAERRGDQEELIEGEQG